MSKACFGILFDYYKISSWNDKYLNYKEIKNFISRLGNLIIRKTQREKLVKKLKNQERVSKLLLEIDTINTEIHFYRSLISSQTHQKLSEMEVFFLDNLTRLKNDFELIKFLSFNCDANEANNILDRIQILNIKEVCLVVLRNDYSQFQKHAITTLFEISTWLRNFSVMNGLAFEKILVKNKELSFELDDRIQKEEQQFLTDYVEMIEDFREDLINYYAGVYCKNDTKVATRQVKIVNPIKIFSEPSIQAFIFVFLIAIATYFLITYISPNNVSMIDVFFPGFNFSFMVIFLYLGLAIDIVIFRYYKINYVYLFELDPSINLIVVSIFNNILTLILFWGILIIMYRVSLSYYYSAFEGYQFVFSLIAMCMVFVFILFPFKCFLHHIRLYFLKIFLKFIFPFGKNKVKFKEVIFGGIITTLSRAYNSLSIEMCLLSCDECKLENVRSYCDKSALTPAFVLSVTAFMLRAFQFFNLVYHKKIYWPHLANAFRFVTSATYVTIAYLHSLEYVSTAPFIVAGCLAFLYNIFWDYFVSWKVLQPKAKYFMLRDKIIYPQWFYYFAIVINFFLRCLWVIRLLPFTFSRDSLFFILTISSIFRRIQFILIRVENEALNNPEKYRRYKAIPEA